MDASYYSSLNGKKDSELRSALTVLLYNKHTLFSKYDWDFPYDYDSSGNLLDIYSDCGFNSNNTYTSDYKCCCDAINREHVICQSNFGGSGNKDKIPQYSDRHHLYPVDGRSNGHRSDLPFGECSSGSHGTCSTASIVYPSEGTSTCQNHEYGKSGTSTFSVALPSGGGSVYEVGDEYKGDIARAVLYMVIRYAESQYCRLPSGAQYCSSSGGGAVSSNLTTANSYPVTAWANTTANKVGQMFSSSLSTNYGLSNYGKAILLKWHQQDPVSQKEIDRNNGVEAVQGNRNPFVDYPCLVEYLWGSHTGENFNTSLVRGSFESGFVDEGCSCSDDPAITLPNGTIAFGATNTSTPLSQTVTVRGVNLSSGNLTLSLSGANAAMFSLSTTSISKAQAEAGYTITITYSPTAVANHTATLSIYGCGITQGNAHTVTLTGSCEIRHTVTWLADGNSYHTNTVANNQRPDMPGAPDDCSVDRVFVGWTAQSNYNNTTEAPNDLFPTSVTTTAPLVTSDITFYAVYATATVIGASNRYVLYEEDLTEGNYVMYYSGKAMKAEVSSNRLNYIEVTPTHDSISSPDASIVWHIAQNGNYWTIYNEAQGKYAASTGVANKAQLLADGTDDKAQWVVNDISTYDFVNKTNLAAGINAYLRNNTTYGFACYAPSTGGEFSLYKQAANISYNQYSVNCSAVANNVTVTFHANGGSGAMPHQTVPENVATALSANAFTYECHTFAGWATSADGAKVYDNQEAVTIDSDIDLYAVWTENPNYTVIFKNNGADYATRTGCAGQTIAGITAPTPCEGYTFEGWSTNTYAANNTTLPSINYTGTIPSANTTYHAVYKKEEAGGETELTDNYVKINSLENLTTGNYIIVGYYNNYYAMNTTTGSTSASKYYLSQTQVTPSNDIITTTDAAIIWKVTVNDNKVTFYNENVRKYAYVYGEGANFGLNNYSTYASFTYSVSSGVWTFRSVSYTSYYLEHYASKFQTYTGTGNPMYLYKQQEVSTSTTYYSTSTDCGCTVTVTAISEDDSQGTVTVTKP